MKYAVVDVRMPPNMKENLKSFAERVLELPPHPKLAAPVASHPDMLLWKHGNTVITYQDYALMFPNIFEVFEKEGYKIITSAPSPAPDYPRDVGLNCAVLGNTVIGNTKYIRQEIINEVTYKRLSLVHTNQGYAKCSTATVSENSVITADPSIYRAACGAGIECLKISGDHVELDGYDKGFIGGACGLCGDTLIFCGDISFHPDATLIQNFCSSYDVSVFSLSSSSLYDYGTVVFL